MSAIVEDSIYLEEMVCHRMHTIIGASIDEEGVANCRAHRGSIREMRQESRMGL